MLAKLFISTSTLAICWAGAAIAQETGEGTRDDRVLDRVVVVGSQVAGVDIDGDLPVTVVSAEDIEAYGVTSGEELLRSIPQMGSIGFGAARGGITGVNADRSDVASFNLRSLSEGNTLVLINGRRMVQHPITQSDSAFGVPVATTNSNTLPPSALKRVEVLRDGAAAIYGADAVAGVVNFVLDDEYEGGSISVQTGAELDGGREDYQIKATKGFQFNEGRTSLILSGSYDKRNGVMATEKSYSASEDLRSRAPEFASDTSLDFRSSLEPFPLVNFNGLGSFHLRPATLATDSGSMLTSADCGGLGLDGETLTFTDGLESLCLDSSSQDRALRPNRNEHRTMVPDNERFNLFSYFKHDVSDDMELYGEASYYRAVTNRVWEQASILSNGRFYVPADYYWNPFGPVYLEDGSLNPNRLPGLDTSIVPEEGLGFQLTSFRPVDIGPRQIEVTSTSYRALAGVRGSFGDWDYDSALLYSTAKVKDVASNRVRTSLLQQQLSLNTSDAYNIFTGINPGSPSSIVDQTVNPQSSIDPFLVSATREAETSLAQIDFRVSNASVYQLPAGGVGLAAGVELRREELTEDNSSIFDGSEPFIDPYDETLAEGEVTNLSDLQGSSVRPDLSGDRQVFSAYAEMLIPVLRDVPGARSVDIQAALRYENFDDVGDITRPKIALAWEPVERLKFRAAYSLGFRAPNLVQLHSPSTSITTSVNDYAEGMYLGTGSIDDGPANGNYILETAGNEDLKPEESENISVGFVLSPTSNITLTGDFWRIETENTVGVLSDENISRLDAILRASGSSSPDVIRSAPDTDNPLGEILIIRRGYENLNTRVAEGFDVSFVANFDTKVGSFGYELNGARLLTFEQEAGNEAQTIVDFGADTSVLGTSVGDLIEKEFFPKWRGTSTLTWTSPNELWTASLFANYIGKVEEPSVSVDGEFMTVDAYTTVNASVMRRDIFGENSSVRLGINNIADEDPPLAAESYGYEGELHSNLGRYVFISLSKSF